MLRSSASIVVLAVSLASSSLAGQEPEVRLPEVPSRVRSAVGAYLKAAPDEEERTLAAALRALEGKLALATAALRSLPPLTRAKPGSAHGLVFESRGRHWEYSIHLPETYPGKGAYPVIVLPDHGAVGARAGIDFWTRSPAAAEYIFFRPVIVKHSDDRSRFPSSQFFERDQAIAGVMRDALTHLRLNYAVDHDRISLTGLSQAGYYSWYYAVSFPDQFAAVIPESSGGLAVRAAVVPLAPNLVALKTRILHTRGDQITPYADAEAMRDAIESAGGSVGLITYTASDYSRPPPKLHPGPHSLRLSNVLSWASEQKRSLPREVKRVLRYRQQGLEGRFRVQPPNSVKTPVTLECKEENGVLSANQPGVRYLVDPIDILRKRTFRVGKKRFRPRGDIELMLTEFKKLGDPQRLVAAEIPVT